MMITMTTMMIMMTDINYDVNDKDKEIATIEGLCAYFQIDNCELSW